DLGEASSKARDCEPQANEDSQHSKQALERALHARRELAPAQSDHAAKNDHRRIKVSADHANDKKARNPNTPKPGLRRLNRSKRSKQRFTCSSLCCLCFL